MKMEKRKESTEDSLISSNNFKNLYFQHCPVLVRISDRLSRNESAFLYGILFLNFSPISFLEFQYFFF